MRVLAIDTALAACSAAVLDTASGGVIASESLIMERGHAEALLPMLDRVMARAELEFADIDRITVTVGPGSFTGLRVGISAARGIALAAEKPAFGVTTLSAHAAPYLAQDQNTPVVTAIDARHEHVYLQVFDARGSILVSPRLAPLSAALRAASEKQVRLVGSAARMVAARMPVTAPVPLQVDDARAPDIAWVARMGAVLPETDTLPKPLYLRAPDAQPQHATQLPRR